MLTFDQYIQENIPTPPRPSSPTTIPAPLLDSLRLSGLLPATDTGTTSISEAVTFLLTKLVETHRSLVAGSSTLIDKRQSYETLVAGFVSALALAGSYPGKTEDTQ